MDYSITPKDVKAVVDIPQLAWPTISLFVFCLCSEISVIYALNRNLLSCYTATTVNAIVIYAVFTVMHDASHGSVAGGKFTVVNSCIGRLAATCFPIPFPAFKHLHLLHHKHTNGPNDPDLYAGTGPTLLLPLRWLTIEIRYYTIYLSKIHLRPRLEATETVITLACIVIGTIWAYSAGFGREVFWGMILPGRLAIGLLAFLFDYLPHRGHDVTKEKDPFRATSVTSLTNKNNAWCLTWPLLHQNYHNIHHLVPYVPFYQYSTLWYAFRHDLLKRGTEIKPIFE